MVKNIHLKDEMTSKVKSHLCPSPTKSVLLPLLGTDADTDISNQEGNHIAHHVKAVGNEGHAVGDVAHHQLDHHVR